MFNDEDDSIADVWEFYNDPMYQLENKDPDVEEQSIWNEEEDEDE